MREGKRKRVVQQKCKALVLEMTKNYSDGKRAEENIAQEGMRKGMTGRHSKKRMSNEIKE